MKNVLRSALIFLLIFVAGMSSMTAQQRIEEKTMKASSDERIRVNLKFGESIVIKGWDREEVSFRAVVEINRGKLNDAFVVNYLEDAQGIRIDSKFDQEKLKADRGEDCFCKDGRSFSWNEKGVICTSIVYEIFIPRNADLNLETISADVEMYNVEGPINARSVSGFVDLSWPSRRGAELTMKTVTGEAYTDLANINFSNRKDHAPLVGYELRGTIGAGGPAVRLESVSGDLFLRDQEG